MLLYRLKSKKIVVLAAVVMALTGCEGARTQNQPRMAIYDLKSFKPASRVETYDIYVYDDEYKLEMYEPEEGCYVGAYILSDRSVDFDIEKFENLMKKRHELYAYHMNLGDKFPVNWVLSCVANMKTPYVILKTPRAMSSDDWSELRKTAESFNDFYVPMFVDFNPADVSAPPDAYVSAFKKARKMFAETASNVAFVWSVDVNDVEACEPYYPGDEWVNWVGVRIMESLDPDREYAGDALDGLDEFCAMFQRKKPVMLSRFAVSRVNSRDYAYYTDAAAKEIERVYNAVATKYPRVKGVIYMDFNGIATGGIRENRDDFSITGDSRVIEAYGRAVSRRRFITGVVASMYGDVCPQEYKFRFNAYKSERGYFVPEAAFAENFQSEERPKRGYDVINGERCAFIGDESWFEGIARLEKRSGSF
ncbi:MAG: hypothetical protein LBL35_05085 [Clostridiales bacterium]|jgi:hypothetical protein|nr:hypothetical protein [Clostridiales bacterium]